METISLAEASRLYGVHQNTLRGWIAKGLLPASTGGAIGSGRRGLRVAVDDVERLCAQSGAVRRTRFINRAPEPGSGAVHAYADDCLTLNEAAAAAGVSLGTIRGLISAGRLRVWAGATSGYVVLANDLASTLECDNEYISRVRTAREHVSVALQLGASFGPQPLTLSEAARTTGVPRAQIERLIVDGKLPRRIMKHGRLVLLPGDMKLLRDLVDVVTLRAEGPRESIVELASGTVAPTARVPRVELQSLLASGLLRGFEDRERQLFVNVAELARLLPKAAVVPVGQVMALRARCRPPADGNADDFWSVTAPASAWMTVSEAAAYLGVTVGRLNTLVEYEAVTTYVRKPGGWRMFRTRDLNQLRDTVALSDADIVARLRSSVFSSWGPGKLPRPRA